MERIFIACSALALSFLPTACKQAPQSSTPPVLSLPRPGVHLVATPASGKDCDASGMRVHFDWDVGDPQDAGSSDAYDMHVGSPIGPVFGSGRRNGHADTENWVYAGQWFFLVNQRTREVIAALRIGPDTCD